MAEAVLADISEEWCLAGSKAVGWLGKCFTSPLWCLLEVIYTDVVSFVSNCSSDEALLSQGIYYQGYIILFWTIFLFLKALTVKLLSSYKVSSRAGQPC